MDTLLALIARTHPMILHLPIGVLFVIVSLEVFSIFKQQPDEPTVRWRHRRDLAILLALTAPAAAITGWLLADHTNSIGQTTQLHRWIGIAFAGLTPLLLFAALRQASKLYTPILIAAAALCIPTGHYGAALTHGPGYLTAPLRQSTTPTESPTIAVAIENPSYTTDIIPIFESTCYSCHGESKQKGSLAMHTPEDLLYGGESAPAIIPGNAKASEIVYRLSLPLEDELHMPPESKPQLSQAQIQTVINWINNGAQYDD
ncbi:MAG: c-type cytochrome domain-containing protein [Phycisphaerales bacterium]